MDSKFSNQYLNSFEIEEEQQEENSLSINSDILPEQDLEKEIINMPENNNNVAQDIVSAMTIAMATLLEQQKQQNNNFNNDYFNKPRAYHGERDPQIIDLWIRTIITQE
jgi:S-adenosylhomocysteine hydrolase